MQKSDYQQLTIDRFNGLYKRGMADQCPSDHAVCCDNCKFPKPGEVSSRDGVVVSYALNHPVKRGFLASFDDNTLELITLDYEGNLYRDNDPTPIFTDANLDDFAAINLFNKCFILPLGTTFPPPNLQVLSEPLATIRDAAGVKPSSAVTAADGAAGKVDVGVHKIAVSYITDTGFITPPNAVPTVYAAPGDLQIDLTNIPVSGASHIVGRKILVTRANEEEFFFVEGGQIDDNVTTILTLDFYDSDLVISADYLFDLLETIPGGIVSAGLMEYHGCLVSTAEGDLVRVSRSGDPESFNNVNGFIQVPAQRDGNVARSLCKLRDTLYIMKAIGIYAVEDNFSGDPSSWQVHQIDGGAGSYQNAISTITGSQPALSAHEVFTLAHRGGVFAFAGAILDRPLTWKIDDVWQKLTHGREYKICVSQDPFNQTLYVLIPYNGASEPNLLLVGDYSEGLNWKNIKWSMWFFPFTISWISMMNFLDDEGASGYDYYLRLGASDENNIYKLKLGQTSDYGNAIVAFYQAGFVTPAIGAMNVFRAVQFRARGIGTLDLKLYKQDLTGPTSVTGFALSTNPQMDFLRQINFTHEKLMIWFGVDAVDEKFQVDRIDIFGKRHFATRPA